MGRGQTDSFKQVMGTRRGRHTSGASSAQPRGRLPLARATGNRPHTCAEMREALSGADASLPLYAVHIRGEHTLEEAERVTGARVGRIPWDKERPGRLYVETGSGATSCLTMGDFLALLSEQEDQEATVFFEPQRESMGSSEHLCGLTEYADAQGRRYLALVTIY